MSYSLLLAYEAQYEETDAFNYYEEIRRGLGDDLIMELEKCYTKISENPFYYSFLENSNILRHTKINRFPYVIIYIVSGNSITILSVRNTHRQPFI